MENKQNKNMWIALGAVLIVLGLGAWYMNMSPTAPLEDTGTENVESVEDTTEGSVNAGATAATISYANALVKYKDARIQLNRDCQATPNNVTFKNGTSIMIDNRSSVNRLVKVGTSFAVKPYGFKIVKLSSSTTPATWYVDCDKSQNVATILIQK